MRRISAISWVLIVIGVALVVVGILYLTKTPPNLPSFIPGVVAHPKPNRAYKHKYTKRALASFIVAALAFVGVFYKDFRRA